MASTEKADEDKHDSSANRDEVADVSTENGGGHHLERIETEAPSSTSTTEKKREERMRRLKELHLRRVYNVSNLEKKL